MRFYEFADAEAQLGLLRTIIDNTWTAIAQQAEQKRRADAERKAKAKLKTGSKKASKGASLRIPTPSLPPPKKPQAALPQQPPLSQSKPTPNTANALKPQPSTNSQLNPLPSVKAVEPKHSTTIPIKTSTVATNKRQNGSKTASFGRNIGAVEKDDDGDERYSKNGIAALQKLPRSF